MLRVLQVGPERSSAWPILLVLEELLRRRIAEKEAMCPADQAARASAPCWVGGLAREDQGYVRNRGFEARVSD